MHKKQHTHTYTHNIVDVVVVLYCTCEWMSSRPLYGLFNVSICYVLENVYNTRVGLVRPSGSARICVNELNIMNLLVFRSAIIYVYAYAQSYTRTCIIIHYNTFKYFGICGSNWTIVICITRCHSICSYLYMYVNWYLIYNRIFLLFLLNNNFYTLIVDLTNNLLTYLNMNLANQWMERKKVKLYWFSEIKIKNLIYGKKEIRNGLFMNQRITNHLWIISARISRKLINLFIAFLIYRTLHFLT